MKMYNVKITANLRKNVYQITSKILFQHKGLCVLYYRNISIGHCKYRRDIILDFSFIKVKKIDYNKKLI